MLRSIGVRSIAVIAAVLVQLVGCDHFYAVSGRVTSCADHRPVEGATVHLSDGERGGVGTSTADGSFDVALNEPDGDGASTLTLAKPGYQTASRAVADPHAAQAVCMSSDAKSPARPLESPR